MSQADALKAMDAAIHTVMVGAGFAFIGTYTPPASAPGETITDVRGYFDEAVAAVGEFAQSNALASELSLFRESIPRPAQHAVVAFDGRRLKLDALIARDESITRWAVSHV